MCWGCAVGVPGFTACEYALSNDPRMWRIPFQRPRTGNPSASSVVAFVAFCVCVREGLRCEGSLRLYASAESLGAQMVQTRATEWMQSSSSQEIRVLFHCAHSHTRDGQQKQGEMCRKPKVHEDT